MKVNLKKIGAIVAGATILASSVAFAGLWFGNTQLVNDNGAPAVKVVVGEGAAASDGVAAANIAAKIASSAFKSQELKAELKGEPTCSAGSGEGKCAISNEKVTLEITVPGTIAEGTYQLQTLIGDNVDRLLIDRGANSLSSSGYAFGSDATDTSNPFTDSSTYLSGGPSDTSIFKVDGGMFTPFAKYTVEDPYAGKTYTEEQTLWLKGKTRYSESKDAIVADLDTLAYVLKFKGATDDLGIQKCTTPTNTTLYASCTSTSNSDYLTSTHKTQVSFLGEPWVISEMDPPTTALTTETGLVSGGYVKLAKESVTGVLNQGDSFDLGDVKIVLDDLEAHGETVAAIVSIVDKATEKVLKKDKASVGTTKEISAGGKIYRVHLYKVAPGYTYGAKWADMAVYSKELKLQSGSRLDPDYDNNKEWRVVLGWKNKGGASTDDDPDSLRMVGVWTSDAYNLINNNLVKGDYAPLVQDPVKWKLSFAGLTTVEYDSLKFTMTRDSAKNNMQYIRVTGTADAQICNLSAPYVYVSSSKDGAVFTVSSAAGGSGSGASNKFYVAVGGIDCNTTDTANMPSGAVIMPESSTSDDYWVLRNYSGAGGTLNVTYSLAGDSQTWSSGGVISVQNWSAANTTANGSMSELRMNFSGSQLTNWVFGVSEKAGTGESYTYSDHMIFGLDVATQASSSTFNYDETTYPVGDTSGTAQYLFKKDYIRYVFAGPTDSGNTTKEEGFITERGSQFVAVDDESVQFKVAKDLAYAKFVLAAAEGSSSSEATTKILAEGDETTISGVKIKVKDISETVGACSVGTGAAPACTVDTTGVSAVIMPEDKASVMAALPYTGSLAGLVVLDKDASDTDVLVMVGGPAVNTVTAAALEGSAVDFTATPVVVKEVVAGKKIVVAGLTADDTLSAAADFVSQLKSQ